MKWCMVLNSFRVYTVKLFVPSTRCFLIDGIYKIVLLNWVFFCSFKWKVLVYSLTRSSSCGTIIRVFITRSFFVSMFSFQCSHKMILLNLDSWERTEPTNWNLFSVGKYHTVGRGRSQWRIEDLRRDQNGRTLRF